MIKLKILSFYVQLSEHYHKQQTTYLHKDDKPSIKQTYVPLEIYKHCTLESILK